MSIIGMAIVWECLLEIDYGDLMMLRCITGNSSNMDTYLVLHRNILIIVLQMVFYKSILYNRTS